MVVEVYKLPQEMPKLVDPVDLVVAVAVMILVDHTQVVPQTQPHKDLLVGQEWLPEQMLVEVAEH